MGKIDGGGDAPTVASALRRRYEEMDASPKSESSHPDVILFGILENKKNG